MTTYSLKFVDICEFKKITLVKFVFLCVWPAFELLFINIVMRNSG